VPGFRRVLDAVDDAWQNRRSEVEQQADHLLEVVARRTRLTEDLVGPTGDDERSVLAPRLLAAAASELHLRFDARWGGFGPAPKFPNPVLVELSLQHHRLSASETTLVMARSTLEAMAAGGIYDHLGGGFHRYSTDDTWTVPHFEKMLYDQAALVRVYLHAWQATQEARFLAVVEETIGYVLRELALPSGGLCSAEDADSEGEEGRFYVWTPSEMTAVLGPQLGAAASEWYGVTDRGNFKGSCILRRPPGGALERPPEMERTRVLLLAARATRVRPARDDKVLTEWNAMFGAALAEAAQVTGRDDWAEAAVAIARFLMSSLRRDGDGRWLRSWQGGRARHFAYAADYAWLVDFFTRLAELTGKADWLEEARQTAQAMLRLFAEPGLPLYTTGVDAQGLLVRPMETTDTATPSATSVAAAALLRLGALCGDEELSVRGESLLKGLLPSVERQPLAHPSALLSLCLADGGITQVVVAGQRPDLLAEARSRYEPNQVLSWGERTSSPLWEGRTEPFAYVCRHYACQAPSSTAEDLRVRLDAELLSARERFALATGT
jgi:uncharacterized protein YyaL (SSP411 family)